MSDNWVVQNLENALATWNEKLTEIWQLITQSPETFKGGTIWNVVLLIHDTMQAIGLALLVAMAISSAVGTLIPLFFKKINIDPAVASGPLITTVNDLVAVVTYYGLSWLLLLQIMHLAG